MKTTAPNIMVGTLTHNDQLHSRMAKAFFTHDTQKFNSYKTVQPGSLLANGYNQLWTRALNNRKALNLKYLAILHADIVPEDFWVDKLVDLAQKHDADVMSAIVPIKEATGVTSTAISSDDSFRRLTRLTQAQINSRYWPSTFDINTLRAAHQMNLLRDDVKISIPDDARLLVNTGCVVIRCDREWSSEAYFTIKDRIVTTLGGALQAEVEPEDWFFSRLVAELGGRVMATSEVKTEHIGSIPYISNKVWGDLVDGRGLFQSKHL